MDSPVEIPNPIIAPKKTTYDDQEKMVLVTPEGIEEEKIYNKLDDGEIDLWSMTRENYLYKFDNGTVIDEDLKIRILDDYNKRRRKEKEEEELKLKQEKEEEELKLKQKKQEYDKLKQEQKAKEQEQEQKKTHLINDNNDTKYFKSIINFLNKYQDVKEGFVINNFLNLRKFENIKGEYNNDTKMNDEFAKNSDGYFKKIDDDKVYINLEKEYWESFDQNLSIRPVRNSIIQDAIPVDDNQKGGKRKSRRNRKSKKGKKSRKARKSRRKSNRRRGRR